LVATLLKEYGIVMDNDFNKHYENEHNDFFNGINIGDLIATPYLQTWVRHKQGIVIGVYRSTYGTGTHVTALVGNDIHHWLRDMRIVSKVKREGTSRNIRHIGSYIIEGVWDGNTNEF